MTPLIEARNLRFSYSQAAAWTMRAQPPNWVIDDVSLSIPQGATVGIVGESGSGKSTLVRLLCGLLQPAQGDIVFEGRPLREWIASDQQRFRRANQMVFQSPASSFDPRMRIQRSLQEPVRAIERRVPGRDEIVSWLARVGLGAEVMTRFPHQLSGGQLQRVAIARALSLNPRVLYADEPTSALDVSVQAKVLNLLMDLRTQFGLTLVLVTHDLAVVGHVCEHIVVMRNGGVVESGPAGEVLGNPKSEYTRALIAAADAVVLDDTN